MEKVSVVMATYNGESYILQQLNSLYEQTRKPDEVIIIDDKSNDLTVKLIKEFIFSNRISNWSIYQNNENIGWKKNFKKGFDLASGDYIFPCDQDDVWEKYKIEVMIDSMKRNNNISLLVSNYSIFYSNIRKKNIDNYKHNSKKMKNNNELQQYHINPKWAYVQRPGCVYCFKKEFYSRIKEEWNVKYPHDAILWRYALMNDGLWVLNIPTIKFRRHGDNATSNVSETVSKRMQTLNDYIYFYKKALKTVKNNEYKKILEKGIYFLKLRIRFLENPTLINAIKLLSLHQYYLSIKGWFGDIYIGVTNNRK